MLVAVDYSKSKFKRRLLMTLKDISSMKVGQVVKVLVAHRNLGDIVCETNKRGRPYSPTYFYRGSAALIKKTPTTDEDGRVLWKTPIFGEPDIWEEVTLDFLIDGHYRTLEGNPNPNPNPKTVIGIRGPFIAWSNVKLLPPTFWV